MECIDHIRFLSWILIGSLTHSALTRNKGTVISYPIPINCGNYIGEHIFYILNGFAEHSKTSAIHMSSLFHSFILCQVNINNTNFIIIIFIISISRVYIIKTFLSLSLISLSLSLFYSIALDNVQRANTRNIWFWQWLKCIEFNNGILEQNNAWYFTITFANQSGNNRRW